MFTPNGVFKVRLKQGAAQKAKIVAIGKGEPLPEPGLPLTAPVAVQLVNSQTSVCWGDAYNGAQIIKNDPELFKGKAVH